jgi:hypothetical protein
MTFQKRNIKIANELVECKKKLMLIEGIVDNLDDSLYNRMNEIREILGIEPLDTDN